MYSIYKYQNNQWLWLSVAVFLLSIQTRPLLKAAKQLITLSRFSATISTFADFNCERYLQVKLLGQARLKITIRKILSLKI